MSNSLFNDLINNVLPLLSGVFAGGKEPNGQTDESFSTDFLNGIIKNPSLIKGVFDSLNKEKSPSFSEKEKDLSSNKKTACESRKSLIFQAENPLVNAYVKDNFAKKQVNGNLSGKIKI